MGFQSVGFVLGAKGGTHMNSPNSLTLTTGLGSEVSTEPHLQDLGYNLLGKRSPFL